MEEENTVKQEEIVNYYIISKGDDLERYDVEDLLYILTTGSYTKLSFNVTDALYHCLSKYKFIHTLYRKTNYITESKWIYEGRDGIYKYEIKVELPFTEQSKDCYERFFDYYAKEVIDMYFKVDIHDRNSYIIDGDKRIYTSPLRIYYGTITRMYEVVYYYLGKKKTDIIMDTMQEEFARRFVETDFYNKMDDGELWLEETKKEIAENYRLMRNRTRLNKGEAIR